MQQKLLKTASFLEELVDQPSSIGGQRPILCAATVTDCDSNAVPSEEAIDL
jgi:hypothetical protein